MNVRHIFILQDSRNNIVLNWYFFIFFVLKYYKTPTKWKPLNLLFYRVMIRKSFFYFNLL